MSRQRRNHFCKGLEPYCFCADRHNDEYRSDDASENQEAAQYIEKCLHNIFNLLVSGCNSPHEHPEGQHGGGAVDKITYYCAHAPGFFFPAEHARHDADNSGELKDS